jgi:hypothetical protein
MWIEETRGGLLSCEKRMTALAESATGSRARHRAANMMRAAMAKKAKKAKKVARKKK